MKNLVRVGGTQILSDLYTDDFSSRRGGGDGGGVKLHIYLEKFSVDYKPYSWGIFSSSTGKLKSTKQVTFEKVSYPNQLVIRFKDVQHNHNLTLSSLDLISI